MKAKRRFGEKCDANSHISCGWAWWYHPHSGKEISVLEFVKGEERYVFLYDEQNCTETLRMLGRYAADPQLSFTWYDAAVISKKIRENATGPLGT